MNQTILVKGGVATAALALGGWAFTAARSRGSNAVIPEVAQYPEVVRQYPALASSMCDLKCGGKPGELEELMKMLEEIRQLDVSREKSAQWKLGRLITSVTHRVGVMCSDHNDLSKEGVREALYLRDEVEPMIATHLQNILYNHLIREN